jgi:hypothetical protein
LLEEQPVPDAAPTKFQLMIGASVPRQVPRSPLPRSISQLLGGFDRDQYVLAGDTLVIIDSGEGRVAALIPGVR